MHREKIDLTSRDHNQRRVLVIGGSGYIGSHLVKELIATGRSATVLGRSKLPRFALPGNVKYVVGDYSNSDTLKSLLDEHQEVIHLAYATVPNTSFDHPLVDLQQNLPSSIQLFSEVAARDIKLLLVSSGGAVYGNVDQTPISEDQRAKPISPYGVTKLTLEQYAYLYSITHNLKFICVRPSNAYGENQLAFTGQGFIATSIASILLGKSIKIFGKQGTVRDYIHVSDLVSGIVSALQRGVLSETYNIGSGEGYSNAAIIKKITLLMGETEKRVAIENLPERLFDVKSNILDCSKLNAHTGWETKISLDEGLSGAIDYMQTLAE